MTDTERAVKMVIEELDKLESADRDLLASAPIADLAQAATNYALARQARDDLRTQLETRLLP